MRTPITNNWRKLLPILLGFLAPMTLMTAQSEDKKAKEKEEIFELSPFEVSVEGDQGYLSTNAISGTSLNTAIRDLPMPLEVINSELIEDLQATDLEESLEYSAGVYTESFANNSTGANEGSFSDNSPSSTNLNSEFTNTISLRGYTVPNNQRFGFRVGAIVPAYGVVLGGSTDTITTERIEVVRGPQALLYGINVLSGIVNIIPKEPLFDPAYQANVSAGSYGYRRASVDATGPLIKQKLAYRLLASYTEEDHWTMFQSTEREDYALQLKWRITPKYDLFVEAKKSKYHQIGIGPQYFEDNESSGNSGFRWENEWNERIVYGRDDVTAPIVSDLNGRVFESPFVPRSDYEYAEKFSDYGPYYRISGPDTYYDRDEVTVTGLLRARFSEHFSAEFGVYHVEQEDKTFNVDLRTFSDSYGPAIPFFSPKGKFGRPPTENDVKPGMRIWYNNPEISHNGQYGPLDQYEDENYMFNQGLGEVFVFPYFASSNDVWPEVARFEDPQEFDDPDSKSFNRRFARYVWYEDENKAESTQLRARLAYNFDQDILGVPITHLFSLGANYIGDIVDFNIAWIADNYDNYLYSSDQSNPSNSRQDADPYYFRESVLDFSPLRYSGENVALLARPSFSELADFSTGAASGQNGATIARSGKKEATLWYRGFYGLYQGKLWNDKFHIIAGIREDQYQVKEREDLMIIDQLRASDVWQGNVDPLTPWYIGDGTGEYKSPDGIPAELDEKVRTDYAHLQELQPEGTVDYNFDDYQKFQTGTFGFSYRIIDPVSVYYLYSEGVFPNTGQRDGAYNPIDAEQTVNNEIGVKFDLMDGKISGTLSFYKIERENAVYRWRYAPAPANWHGGPWGPTFKTTKWAFSPQAAAAEGSEYLNGVHYPVTYGVAMTQVYKTFVENGIEDQFPGEGGSFPGNAFSQWGATEVISREVHEPKTAIHGRFYVMMEAEKLNTDPNAEILKQAFEKALAATDDPIGIPFFYASSNEIYNNNPSNNTGANVTFGEEGTGVDGQIIYTPIPNYQIVFSYSYQKREVTSFNLVDAVDLETGTNWGTPWDIWVYLLRPENFEDPTRASTFNGGSVRGMDLSFVPQYSGKLWNMYRFTDGPLAGLKIGGGVQYIGSAPTSVPIGGDALASNVYATPDTKERFICDASVSYKWEWGDFDWFLSLRISNLFDETEDTVEVQYIRPDDITEKRRTRVYYAPRTWRLSLTTKF